MDEGIDCAAVPPGDANAEGMAMVVRQNTARRPPRSMVVAVFAGRPRRALSPPLSAALGARQTARASGRAASCQFGDDRPPAQDLSGKRCDRSVEGILAYVQVAHAVSHADWTHFVRR